jgi:hypothetical protein
MSILSNFAETRMDKGFHKDAQLNTLNEQVNSSKSAGPSRSGHLCGTKDREKALVTETAWGGHHRVVCVVNW